MHELNELMNDNLGGLPNIEQNELMNDKQDKLMNLDLNIFMNWMINE